MQIYTCNEFKAKYYSKILQYLEIKIINGFTKSKSLMPFYSWTRYFYNIVSVHKLLIKIID